MVETLTAMYDASEVLFVDDEAANSTSLSEHEHTFMLRCALSLEVAVNGEPETADDEAEEGDDDDGPIF